ncbi:MAG: hypothetical protein A2289_23740 [Deltaproteobacteria bacterium RIFOXYA12_FULL_58_15]|nr:MAG: hypothetical protein A2289_23740 [Deltaproteobacteria bacterium RIFOXYA12_FULL_58_15]
MLLLLGCWLAPVYDAMQAGRLFRLALPRKTKAPKVDFPPLGVFWFSDAALSEGVETAVLDGVGVRIFNLPKTVVGGRSTCRRCRVRWAMAVERSMERERTPTPE